MDQQVARQQLETLLRELDDSTETLRGEGAGEGGELSRIDQHPAEAAGAIDDAQRQAAVLEVAASQREQVAAALARLDAGTYGTCVACGRPIPDERLEARPEAAYDVECQARHEGGR